MAKTALANPEDQGPSCSDDVDDYNPESSTDELSRHAYMNGFLKDIDGSLKIKDNRCTVRRIENIDTECHLDDIKLNVIETLLCNVFEKFKWNFFDTSEMPGFIPVLLQRCLKSLRVESEICFGYQTAEKNKSLPAMWVKLTTETESKIINCNNLTNAAEVEEFIESDYLSESDIRYVSKMDYCTKELIKFFAKFPDQALALCIKNKHVRVVYFSIIRAMWRLFKVSVQGVEPSVRNLCWFCNTHCDESLFSDVTQNTHKYAHINNRDIKPPLKPSQCGACRVAVYCSRGCQGRDWRRGHNVHCRIAHARVVHHSKDLAREIAAKAKEFDADVNVKVKSVLASSEDFEVFSDEDISEMCWFQNDDLII